MMLPLTCTAAQQRERCGHEHFRAKTVTCLRRHHRDRIRILHCRMHNTHHRAAESELATLISALRVRENAAVYDRSL